jgi:hypothetical protein
MKKNRAKKIIEGLKEVKYLRDAEATSIVYQRIEEELEKELEELEKKNKELISIIRNHIISLNPNLI